MGHAPNRKCSRLASALAFVAVTALFIGASAARVRLETLQSAASGVLTSSEAQRDDAVELSNANAAVAPVDDGDDDIAGDGIDTEYGADAFDRATASRSVDTDYDPLNDGEDQTLMVLRAARAYKVSNDSGGGSGGGPDDPDGPDSDFCHRNRYRKRTLKVVKEMPFVGLFPELQRTRRFEGSGIAYAKGSYWVVFDSLRALGKVDLRFSFRGPGNRLVGAVGEESQFEGISYNAASDTFFVLRESFEHDEHGLVPVTEELRVTANGTNYEVLARCIVRFQLQDINKGFESLVVFERDGLLQMLGMCESNFCKTIIGPDAPGLQRGNGRLVHAVYHKPEDDDDECRWDVKKVIHLPSEAYLLDYSAISFRGDFGTDVAIVSQEDAAVYVGHFDWEAMEFVHEDEDANIFYFPRTEDCHKRYCNVEGVAWIDAERLVFTSDKSKKIQDYRCMEKDQTLHIMSLP